MKKKIAGIFLALVLLLTGVFPTAAYALQAGENNSEAAVKVVTQAITNLQTVLPETESFPMLSDIFQNISRAGSTISSFVSPVNGSLTFLKLIGLMHDGTYAAVADVLRQLQAVNEKLVEMDGKLDNITQQMSAIQASAEFNTRTEKAMMLRDSWRSFKSNYMENGMDRLMSQYRAMLLNGMQNWCRNSTADARKDGGVDNTRLILFYMSDNGVYSLALTDENGIPGDLRADTRYLVLSGDLLPETLSWNVDTYRESLETSIANAIREKVTAGDFDAFTCVNYPEFTASGAAGLTDAIIEQTAKDAADLLIYRISSAEVNKDANFSLEVNRLFANYCSHLLSSEEGLDAICSSFYLTHAFEYQIAADLRNFCSEMALTTGTYGAFAMNVLGMSDFVSQSEKSAAEERFYKTLISIGDAKTNSLTGNGNYCYITNTQVCLSEISFTAGGQLNVKQDGSYDVYESCKSNPLEIGGGITPENMLGDSNTLLLTYLLKSSGENVSVSYLASKIGNGSLDNSNPVISSFTSEQGMPISGSFPLQSICIIGSYFPNYGTVYLNQLPGKATSEYFKSAKMVKGSVCDLSSGKLEVNKVLSAFALYGESHWYWIHDESAIIGGPTSGCVFEYTKGPVETNQVQTPDGLIIHHKHPYSQTVRYNGLVVIPAQVSVYSQGVYNPLQSYRELCELLSPVGISLETDPVTGRKAFEDVPEQEWFSDAVNWASGKGIVLGTDTTHFSPYDTCTRAQMISFLWRAAGSPAVDYSLDFTDVEADAWYADAVRWAASFGITNGTGSNCFSPDGEITREQLAVLIYNYAKTKGDGLNGLWEYMLDFDDAEEISIWADEAVHWCVMNGILKGTGNNMLSPLDTANRAEIVTMLFRYFS